MNRQRLEAFSDGVFAVAITLLILDIRVPRDATLTWTVLGALLPAILIFVLSFVLVGVYWAAHHTMLAFAGPVDRRLVWSNLALLMVIVFIPLTAATLGAHPDSPIAVVFYGGVLSLANAAGVVMWRQATRHHTAEAALAYRRFVTRVHAAPIVVYLCGAALSYASIPAALILYAAVPVFFILPIRWLDRRTGAALAALGKDDE